MNSREYIEKAAKESFKDHGIKKILDSTYECKKEETTTYRFYVTIIPGSVVVTGDIGNIIFNVRDSNQIGWLRGAIGSPSYLFEKISNSFIKKEFDEEAAKEGIRQEMLYELDYFVEGDPNSFKDFNIKQLLEEFRKHNKDQKYVDFFDDWDGISKESFEQEYFNHLDEGDDFPSFHMVFTAELWWVREALRKFVELYDGI